MTRLLTYLAMATIALAATACGRDGGVSLPTAPIRTFPAPLPVSPDAIPIVLGETVTREVTTADRPVATTWGPEPAVRFGVTVPTAGRLRVRVTSAGPGGLTLWVNAKAFWGSDVEIRGEELVQANASYEIAVSMHDPRGPSQTFELTTSLDPQ